jgi:hypothetical protein
VTQHQWKGWAVAGTALYLHQPEGSDHVGLYMQYENDHRQVGGFMDADAAEEVQSWLDTALTAVGLANMELTKLVFHG